VLAQNYQERIFQYEEIFLRELLNGGITNENEIRCGFEYFNIPFNQGFTAAFIRIDHYRTVALSLSEMEKHLLIFNILNIAQEALRDESAQPFIRGFNEVAVILHGQYAVTDKVMLFDRIKQRIFDQAETRVTIGIGRTYDTPAEIAVSAREADAAFRYRHRMGYHAVIPIDFAEPGNHITYRYPTERERRLVYAAAVGDYPYCQNVLSELFDALTQSGKLPDQLVANIIMNITFCLSRYLTEQNLPVAGQVLRFFPIPNILKLSSPKDGYAFMELALSGFCKYVNQYNEEISNNLHEAVKEYVREHFCEHFSISKIAVNLRTTPDHLNKVFMEKERVMLFDYVMWVRVLEAQNLLKDPDLDEEMIAVRIGFDDVKYFRSIFKKYHGETPAEYRARSEPK
jgi:two-component system response regulator YesN